MNKKSLFRLVVGLILVTLLSILVILVMDERRATIEADSAELFTTTYTVGTDHGGIITEQYVDIGDSVSAGQTLFLINSPSVQEGLRNGDIEEANLLYELDGEGQLMITSQVDGVISELSSTKGSFVPANSELAEIADTSAVRVRAKFTLSRRDFNKLSTDSVLNIRLPDGSWLDTTIETLRVIEQEEMITAEVETKISDIDPKNYVSITGTPVQSRVHLADKTLYDRISNNFKSLRSETVSAQ